MVWGEHDNKFKQLNSQLLKECGQLDWTGHAAHALQAFEDPAAATWIDEDDVMAVTAQKSGQTLQQLTGDQQHSSARMSGSPRRAAAIAASARLAALVSTPSPVSASPNPLHQSPGSPLEPDIASAPGAFSAKSPTQADSPQSLPAQARLTVTDAESAAEVSVDPAADIAKLGHRDASTEQAEEAMRQLGSMDFSSEAQQLSSQEGAAAHHISPDTSEYNTQVQASLPHAAQQQDLPQDVEQHDAEMHIATYDDQHSHSMQAAQQADVQTHPSAPVPSSPALSLQHRQSRQLPTETKPPPQTLHSTNAAQLNTTQDLHMHGQESNSSMPAAAVDQTAQAASPAQPANPTVAPDSHPATVSAADHPLTQAATALGPVHPMAQPEGGFQHGHAHSIAAASAACESLMDVDADDPAVQRYRKAEAAVAHLRAQAGAANQLAALQTLLTILRVSSMVLCKHAMQNVYFVHKCTPDVSTPDVCCLLHQECTQHTW